MTNKSIFTGWLHSKQLPMLLSVMLIALAAMQSLHDQSNFTKKELEVKKTHLEHLEAQLLLRSVNPTMRKKLETQVEKASRFTCLCLNLYK